MHSLINWEEISIELLAPGLLQNQFEIQIGKSIHAFMLLGADGLWL